MLCFCYFKELLKGLLRFAHAPGTLLSPWSHVNYTPIYFRISAAGEPLVPPHEPVEISFKEPAEAVASGLMAEPEQVALRLALAEG